MTGGSSCGAELGTDEVIGRADGLTRMARIAGQYREAGRVEIGDGRGGRDRAVRAQLRAEVVDMTVEHRDLRLFEAVQRIAALGRKRHDGTVGRHVRCLHTAGDECQKCHGGKNDKARSVPAHGVHHFFKAR